MAKPSIALTELAEKGSDVDLVRGHASARRPEMTPPSVSPALPSLQTYPTTPPRNPNPPTSQAVGASTFARTLHCVEQVPFMIKDSAGNVTNSGVWTLRNPSMALSESSCYTQTNTDIRNNALWYTPSVVCSHDPGTPPTDTVYVMASAYLQELGNTNGVNRVFGYSMHCSNGREVGWTRFDPVGVFLVPRVY